MTNQSTIDKLIEMRLTSMSDAFITQMEVLMLSLAVMIPLCHADTRLLG